MKLDGPKISAKFALLRKGEVTSVSILFDKITKFAKLAVGKNVVTAKQTHSKDLIFPLAVALIGLSPLTKVWVNYLPSPKNTFDIRVNGEDIYNLIMEEIDFDPMSIEILWVNL